nr:hypothetical protein 17 [bacterium]
MDAKKLALALNILSAIQEYGAPAVRKIVDELEDKRDPTLEEIEALDDMLKDPESYFEKKVE